MIGIGFDIGFTDENVTAGAVVEFSPRGKPALLACLVFEPDMSLDWMQRITSIGLDVFRALKEYRPAFVSYETAHIGAHAQTGLKLAHLGGALLLAAGANGVPIFSVQPSEAKKALTTSGGATKADMITNARLCYGAALVAALSQYPEKRHSHVCDASGIVLAGWNQYRASSSPAQRKPTRRKAAKVL
jgi:Holliday junction resolvasome RuvABC endonuclease subunit